MKPYGVPRIKETLYPDKADIKKFGYATEDRCSRKDRGKEESRKLWKKHARNALDKALQEDVDDLDYEEIR